MNNAFFRVGLGTLLVTALIFMVKQISFVFNPLILLFKTLAMPFLIAGVLYYMFLPVFRFFIKKGMNKTLSIISIFGIFILILTSIYLYIGPILKKQLKLFIESVPEIATKAELLFSKITNNELMINLFVENKVDVGKISSFIVSKVDTVFLYVGNNLLSIVSTLTGAALLIIVVPIVLYYLLRDGDKLPDAVTKMFNQNIKNEVKPLLSEVNGILSSYIQGQLLVSLFVGIFVYIGFLIIGLEYSLLLAIIAMVTNLIPFVGPFISLIFSFTVGITQSFNVALGVIVVTLIVQQIESNTITPYIMGKKLDLHPLTIIFVLLFAGNVAGLLGMLVAVPVFAICKVLFINSIRIYNTKMKKDGKEESKPTE